MNSLKQLLCFDNVENPISKAGKTLYFLKLGMFIKLLKVNGNNKKPIKSTEEITRFLSL